MAGLAEERRSVEARGWRDRRAAIAAATAALIAFAIRSSANAPLHFPPACSGLFEHVGGFLARADPTAPLGRLLLDFDAAALAAAAGLLARSLLAVSSPWISVAVSSAVVFLPAFEPGIGVPSGFAALSVVLMLVGFQERSRALTSIGVALTSSIWPHLGWTLSCIFLASAAVAFGSQHWRRFLIVPASVALSLATLLTIGSARFPSVEFVDGVRPRLACIAPLPHVGDALSISAAGFGLLGPYALGLALLGVVTSARAALVTAAPAWTIAVLVSLDSSASAVDGRGIYAIAMAPAVALGLRALADTTRSSIGRRVAAALLVALVPALTGQAWTIRQASPPSSWGHEDLTLDRFRQRLSALPAGGAVVEDDALTSILLRAADVPVRIAPRLSPVSRIATPASLDGAYAMPRAQTWLTTVGFRASDVPTSPGFARLTLVGECRAITSTWRTSADLVTADALTLTARSADEVGPVIVYLAFPTQPVIGPLSWPTPAYRGLHWTIYDLSEGPSLSLLRQDFSIDGVDLSFPPSAVRHVARLEMWRIPGAPARMTVSLGARPLEVAARMKADAAPQRIGLCPAFPRDAGGFFPPTP